MTNEKVIKEYERFLTNYVGCYADEFGNRPCDYGKACDRCESDYYQNIWLRILHGEVERKFYNVKEKY